jgi:hypothetical protein
MKTDRVFVLLLVVLLPLSGCFDGSVGDADAADDSSESTTVINNYYNNTTVVNMTSVIPDYKYVTFDEELNNGNWDNMTITNEETNTLRVLLGTFNTSANNLYSVVYSAYTCETLTGWTSYLEGACTIRLDSTCGDVIYSSQIFSQATSETTTYMLKGTVNSDCIHEISSFYSTDSLDDHEVIRLHYELGLREIPISPL